MANLLEESNNEVVGKAKDMYSKLTKTQRIVIFVVIGAVAAALLFVAFSTREVQMATLYKDLEAEDSGKMVEYLEEQNIDYQLEDGGRTIKVREEVINKVRIDLAQQGLPEISNVGYELFDNTNLGMSEFVQKLNFRRALEGELSKTIKEMEEVKKARVHIVIPEKALFKVDQKKPTASVTLHLKSGRSISRISIEGIQNLVASSIEGMNVDDVKVVDSKANILSASPLDENTIAGKTALQYQQQKNVEAYLSDKVQSLLNGVLGEGNTKVRVNAELDFTQIEQEKTQYDPEGAVVRSEQNIKDVNESADSLSYPYVSMAKDETNQIANYEISRNIETIIHKVGAIERLTVSALINGTVKIVRGEAGKKIEYTPRSEEEMQKFTQIVRNAVGYDPSRNDQISVLNVPFEYTLDPSNYEDEFPPPWYEIPQNQRIVFLLGSIFTIFLLMILILQSKQVRERMRIALGLPAKVVIDDYEIEEDEKEEEMEELDFDEDELLLLPADIPDQLLLEEQSPLDLEEESGMQGYDSDRSLSDFADADIAIPTDDMSEEQLMKLEIKAKVEQFMEDNPADAVKILRIWLQPDVENKLS